MNQRKFDELLRDFLLVADSYDRNKQHLKDALQKAGLDRSWLGGWEAKFERARALAELQPAQKTSVKPKRLPPAPPKLGDIVMAGGTGWEVKEIDEERRRVLLAKGLRAELGWFGFDLLTWLAGNGRWKILKKDM